MKKQNGATTTTNQLKKIYRPPTLHRYGMISEITTGASGQYGDQGTGVGKRTKPVLRKIK